MKDSIRYSDSNGQTVEIVNYQVSEHCFEQVSIYTNTAPLITSESEALEFAAIGY